METYWTFDLLLESFSEKIYVFDKTITAEAIIIDNEKADASLFAVKEMSEAS